MSELNINNRTIFCRDNLSVLRGINSATIDLIYLDPPFNKNKKFVVALPPSAKGGGFEDIFRRERVKQDWIYDIKEEHPKLHQLLEAVKAMEGYKELKGKKQPEEDKRSYNYCYLVFMAIRLIECKRILKSDGSIYLHCDQTMSHYLKLAMDCIFGESKFRNEIVWKRTSAHNDSSSFGKIADNILFYGPPINKDDVRVPLDPDYVEKFYRYKDPALGVYRASDLSAKGKQGGGYKYEFHGHSGPWVYTEKRMKELEAANRIHLPKKERGMPQRKLFLSENKGQIPSNIWTDIKPALRKERVNYATQKPLALLERIIKASTNIGEIVLDPFCGCSTAPVAAEANDRFWIGIDVSIKAYEKVKERMNGIQKEMNMEGDKETAQKYADAVEEIDEHFSTDAPKRTDDGAEPQNQRFVYVMSHPNYPNDYKVGVATNVDKRIASYQTGDPKRQYKLEHSRRFENANEVEDYIHEKFGAKPLVEGKERLGEWVTADLQAIVDAIEGY